MFIGGISEDRNRVGVGGFIDPGGNQKLADFAAEHDAKYVPIYDLGGKGLLGGVAGGIMDVTMVTFATWGLKTEYNGLSRDELNNQHYDTIYAYSGGTRSAVTALAHQGVSCDTLVLISPIRGPERQSTYDGEIQQILNSNSAKKIIVIQSPDDKLPLGGIYQQKFGDNEDSRIEVHNVPMEKTGISPIEGIINHKNLFDRTDSILKGDASLRLEKAEANPTLSLKDDLGGVNFTSINLNYISVNSDTNGTNFDFILKARKADGDVMGIDIANSTAMATTAFLTGLAMPNDKFWVNLNPWEPDRIIDKQLGLTDVGRIMLEADLQMKKDFSHYGNPCVNDTGNALWKLLDKKTTELAQACVDKYPGEIKDINSIRFGSATRFWIVPDKAFVYANGTEIYIINATLTIYSEPVGEHSFFVVDGQDSGTLSNGCLEELNRSAKEYNQYAKDLEDRMILPYVVEDVNRGDKYRDLRKVYSSLILAQWYKSRKTPQDDIFLDSLVRSADSAPLESLNPWSPDEIWEKYVYSYKKGEFNCWQNETIDMPDGILVKSVLRSSGGVDFARINDHLTRVDRMPQEIRDQIVEVIDEGIAKTEKDILLGQRVHVNQKASSSGTSGSGPLSSPLDERSYYGEDASQNTSCGECPEGWSGPNEKCECWKIESKCPPGWYGPNEKGECWRWEAVNPN